MEDGGGSLGADPRKGGGTEQPRFALIEPFALCQLSLNVCIYPILSVYSAIAISASGSNNKISTEIHV